MIQNITTEQIKIYAKLLKLPTFASYTEVVRQANQDDDFASILLELMKREYDQRQENQNTKRLKQACFPFTKTLEEMDLKQYDGKLSEIFVNELASCQFIKDKKNIVMFGNPGRGKTHMAIGLGLKACEAGMSVLFQNASSLSTELTEARDNYILGKLEKKLQRVDLLIIDEMGYVTFDRRQSELLFKVVSDRSERGSIIITTNLSFSEWTNLFENATLVSALVDRLTFKSYVINMNGDSYRLEQAKKMQNEQTNA